MVALEALKRSTMYSSKHYGRKIGICGQAPGDHQEFAAFHVAEGVDSISLNPDAVMPTGLKVAELETQNKSRSLRRLVLRTGALRD